MASGSGSKQLPSKFLNAIKVNKLKDELKEKDKKIQRMQSKIEDYHSLLLHAQVHLSEGSQEAKKLAQTISELLKS